MAHAFERRQPTANRLPLPLRPQTFETPPCHIRSIPYMKTRFTTESGSLYEIDSTAMTWTRLQHDHAASPYVRSESGDLKELPEIVVGKPVTMKGTAFDEVFKALGGFRLIYTSNVKEIIVPPEVLDSMHTVSQ